MTYKKFLENIENIYANQGDKPESERLRYGQIIMMELWDIWPQKYHKIAGSDKDPFYSDIIHKKPYDLLTELEKEWPVFPESNSMKYKFIHPDQPHGPPPSPPCPTPPPIGPVVPEPHSGAPLGPP